ncbi:MAG: VWA domain-containing protein [Acidobacteria bacterium]|nr:VWA domain-containing protein [Acidobacteriota bacterium]
MKIRFLPAVTAGVVFLVLLLNGSTGLPHQRTIRSEVSIVSIHFNALDKDDIPVNGLKAGDFQIFENGDPQAIEFFSETAKSEEVILTIALIIDTSGSVKDKLRYEIETAAEFFREILRPDKDLALIIQFDSEVNLVQDFTQSQDDLLDALNSIRAGGNTSLYDAVYLAAEEKLRDEAGRKVMVVISDGEDVSSLVSREEAIEAAQKSDALIYGIGVRGGGSRGGFGDLKKFTEQTGGAFFSPRAEFKDIQEAFQKIGRELRGQYSLAYVPTDKRKNGTFRKIEIRCKKRGVRIRARRGYYAPEGNR